MTARRESKAITTVVVVSVDEVVVVEAVLIVYSDIDKKFAINVGQAKYWLRFK